MTNKQLLLALGELDDETVTAAREPLRRGMRRPLRTALIAAAALILCVTAVWGVSATINSYRSTRADYVKTEDDYWAMDHSDSRGTVPVFVDELRDDTGDRYADGLSKSAQYWDEMPGEERDFNSHRVTCTEDGEIVDTGGGSSWHLFEEGDGMPVLSAMGDYQVFFHPDVSYLETNLTPIDGSFARWMETGHGRAWDPGQPTRYYQDQLYSLTVAGGYRTPSGGTIALSFRYHPAMGLGKSVFIGETITHQDVVISADGTKFDILQTRNIIIAEATFPYGQVHFYCVDATWDEVVDQITHLDLNDVPTVFSTGNE